MKKKIKYIDFFFFLYIPFYLLGLALPWLYGLLFYFKDGWGALKRKRFGISVLVFLYVISLLLSVRYEFFTLGRFFASAHNLAVLLFIPVGYYLGQTRGIHLRTVQIFLFALAAILLPYIIVSLFVDFNLKYGGLLSFFGENKYTRVVFSLPYYLGNWKYSRIQFLAPYPTATAFFLVALNTYRNTLKGKLRHVDFFDVVVILIVIFTGARFLLVVIVLQIALKILMKNPSLLKMVLLMSPLVALLGFNLVLLVLESRAGSNSMRLKIYEESFKMMLAESPIIGIGIKPKLPEILGIYPLGSHSTINTFFFKTGILGGLVFLVLYFKSLLKRLRGLIKGFLGKDYERMYIYFSQILFLLAIVFDDVDSDEFYAFCFGLVLGLNGKWKR